MRGPRLARSLAIAAVLGGLTAVAVSWACSRLSIVGCIQRYRVVRQLDPAKGECEGWLLVVHDSKPGFASWFSQANANELNLRNVVQAPTPEAMVTTLRRKAVLPWTVGAQEWPQPLDLSKIEIDANGRMQLDDAPHGTETILTMASGWPLPAMYARYQTDSRPGSRQWDHVWTSQPPPRTLANTMPGLPLGIFWDALLINALLYAALWSLPLIAPPLIRRAYRRRTGRCLACAYDLRATPPGTPCPECGNPAPPSSVPV